MPAQRTVGNQLQNLFVIATVAALLVSPGCGGQKRVKVYPAAGTVTIDGKPVGPAKIVLQPESLEAKIPAATGAIGSDGTFKLHTYKEGDGVAEGKYNVVVVSDPMKMTPVPAAKPLAVEIKLVSGSIPALKFDLVGIKGAKPSIGAPLPIAGGSMPAMPSMPGPRPR